MAYRAAPFVHVDSKDAPKKAAVDTLVVVSQGVGVISVREVEKPIFRMEEHPASIMPGAVVCLIYEDRFGARIKESSVWIVGESGEPLALFSPIRAGIHVPLDGVARFYPVVPEINVVILCKIGMEGEAQQSLIVPTLANVMKVQNQRLLRDMRKIFKGPNIALASPNNEFVCSRKRRKNSEKDLRR